MHKNEAYGWKANLRARRLMDAMEIITELNKGKKVHEVKIAFQLSVMKPTHVSWLPGLYEYIMRSKRVPAKQKRLKIDMKGI